MNQHVFLIGSTPILLKDRSLVTMCKRKRGVKRKGQTVKGPVHHSNLQKYQMIIDPVYKVALPTKQSRNQRVGASLSVFLDFCN